MKHMCCALLQNKGELGNVVKDLFHQATSRQECKVPQQFQNSFHF